MTPTASTSQAGSAANDMEKLDGGGFVKKLYTMVSDDKIPQIQWTEGGDSFIIVEPSKLASEVLGNFFKHKNLPSFIRQLNMYDFNKVQHIADGNLASAADEALEFRNPNFKRGRPDLLKKLERKKGPADLARVTRRPGTALATPTATGLAPEAVLAKLAELREEQIAIHAEFNELRQENQLLWQEAIKSRDRHKRNSDSINAIIRFLGSVYGSKVLEPGEQRNGALSPSTSTATSAQSNEPAQRRRLLIKNVPEGYSSSNGRATEVEIPFEDDDLPVISSQNSYGRAPISKASASPPLFAPTPATSTPSNRFEDLGNDDGLDPSISAALNAIANNSQISDSNDFARLLSSYDFSQPDASTSAIPMGGAAGSTSADKLQLTPRQTAFPLVASSAPNVASLQSYLDLPSSSHPAQLPALPSPIPMDGGPDMQALVDSDSRVNAMTKRMASLQGSIDDLMGQLHPDPNNPDDFWSQFINGNGEQGGEHVQDDTARIESLSTSSPSDPPSPASDEIKPKGSGGKGRKRGAHNDDDDDFVPGTRSTTSRKRAKQ